MATSTGFSGEVVPSSPSFRRRNRAGKLKPTVLNHEQLEGRLALSGLPVASVGLAGPIFTQPIPGPVTIQPVSSSPTVDLGAILEDAAFRVTKSRLATSVREAVPGVTDVRNVRLVNGSGSVTAASRCVWTYRPAMNWFGEARISFDLVTRQGVRTVVGRLRVLPVNDAPVSSGPVSLGTMPEDGARRVTPQQLLSRSSDVDGDRLTVTNVVLSAGRGQLRPQPDGSWIVQPSRDWHGDIRLAYLVSDGRSSTATSATLVVSAVNDKPEASVRAHLGAMPMGTSVQLTAARLLSGARDVDGDKLSVQNVRLIAGRGSVTDNRDGTWTLSAGRDSSTPLTIAYDISDGRLSTGVAATMVVSKSPGVGTMPTGDTAITVPAGSNVAYGPGGITLQSYPGNSLRYTNFPGSEFGLPSPMRIYVNGIYRALVAFIGTHTGRSFTFVDGGKGYTGIFPDSPDVYF